MLKLAPARFPVLSTRIVLALLVAPATALTVKVAPTAGAPAKAALLRANTSLLPDLTVKSAIVTSLPAVALFKTNWSLPSPPVKVSGPPLPVRVSFLSPPVRTSANAPPVILKEPSLSAKPSKVMILVVKEEVMVGLTENCSNQKTP